jgi:hypothetical protein
MGDSFMKFIRSAPAAMAIALGALCSFAVNAQALNNNASLDSASSTSAAVDDSKLEKFADAYVKIQVIQQESTAALKSTSDPTAAQQQQAEVQNKMAEAVQTSGLDVNEFNQIAQAMTTDSNLRAKVVAKVQQRNQSTGG